MPRTINPEMVVLARESKGLTQEELAARIGIYQAKMSKYESGILEIAQDDLIKISEELGYDLDFFYQSDRIYGLGGSMLFDGGPTIFNRKKTSVPVATQKKVQAQVNVLRMQVERLLRGAEIDSVNKFDPLDIDAFDGNASKVAQAVRATWNIPTGPIPNLTAQVESAGGVVLLCDFGTSGLDAAHLWPAGMPPLFFINSRIPTDRYRFTLAHEIGHAIMHRHPTGDIEEEANAFASELLMPAKEISPELGGLSIEVAARLKPKWRVSMAALIYRAHALKLVSDRHCRTLNARLSALGYKTNEPIPLPAERPRVISMLVDIHRKALGYSARDILRLVLCRDPGFYDFIGGEMSPQPPTQNHRLIYRG